MNSNTFNNKQWNNNAVPAIVLQPSFAQQYQTQIQTQLEQQAVEENKNTPETESVSNTEESINIISNPQSVITLEQYLKLYTDNLKLKEENLKLKSKLITTQEDLKQWKEKKVSKNKKLNSEELKNAVIDIILNSGLNIESIPDEVEREIYNLIINQITNSVGLVRKLFICF